MPKFDVLPTPLRLVLGTQFGVYFFGNGMSLVGTWMQRIACSWLVWEWTHSVFWVGVIAAADLFPVLLISPFAGVAADRWDRLRMNIVALSVSAVNAFLIAVLLAMGQLGLASVIVLITVQGITTAAIQPSRSAMVQQMVPREDVGAAVGMNSANVSLARLIGPAIAGAMILKFDIVWVFVINAIVTAAFVFVLTRLKLSPRAPHNFSLSFLSDMAEGFAYVVKTPSLRLILLAMVFGGMLVRATMELIPAIAGRAFGDVTGLAVLTGAAAVGAVISGLTVQRSSASRLLYGVLFWWSLGGIAMIVLTQADSQAIAVLASVVLGASVTRGMISTQTFVQLTTPDDLRGRALGIHGLAGRGTPALGALAIGYIADRIGLDNAVLYASGLLFILMLILSLPIRRAGRTIRDDAY